MVNGRLQRSQALIQQQPHVIADDDDRQIKHGLYSISNPTIQRFRLSVSQHFRTGKPSFFEVLCVYLQKAYTRYLALQTIVVKATE